MTGEDEYPDHWEVDDYLRCEVDHLRASYDALVANAAAEHQRMSDLCQALSTNVTRLDEENVQQRHTIDYLRGQLARRDDDYARLYSQAEDIKEQYRDCASALEAERRHHAAASARVHDLECHALEIVEHSRERDAQVQVEQDAWRMTSQVIYLEQQRWQEMAEDLWEELQEWHAENCGQADDGTPDGRPCACHNLLAAKWDELTHAADYADDGEEARAEVAKLKAQLRHYEGWFGTECRCDDDDCPL